MAEKPPTGPDYDKRVTKPSQLKKNARFRRYFWDGRRWITADYVVVEPPRLRRRYGLFIVIQEEGGQREMILSDMGVTPPPGRTEVDDDIYTVILP